MELRLDDATATDRRALSQSATGAKNSAGGSFTAPRPQAGTAASNAFFCAQPIKKQSVSKPWRPFPRVCGVFGVAFMPNPPVRIRGSFRDSNFGLRAEKSSVFCARTLNSVVRYTNQGRKQSITFVEFVLALVFVHRFTFIGINKQGHIETKTDGVEPIAFDVEEFNAIEPTDKVIVPTRNDRFANNLNVPDDTVDFTVAAAIVHILDAIANAADAQAFQTTTARVVFVNIDSTFTAQASIPDARRRYDYLP